MSLFQTAGAWRSVAALLACLTLFACPVEPWGQHCEHSSDCISDEICVEFVCRGTCNSSADCNNADEACYDGVCLRVIDAYSLDRAPVTDLAAPTELTSVDAGKQDRTSVESGVEDALLADGCGTADAAAVDGGDEDAVIADSGNTDLFIVDRGTRIDSSIGDTSVKDSSVNDTNVNDTNVSDAWSFDAGDRIIYEVQRAGTIVIDGNLDDWPSSNMVRFGDDSGRGTEDNTAVVYLLWDDSALYLAYSVRDTELIAVATAADATGVYLDDCAEFYLDTLADGGTWLHDDDYHFMLNIRNMLADARLDDRSWNSTGWQSAVVLDGTLNDGSGDVGYTVEMKLPWSGMSAVPGDGTVMGLDLCVSDADTDDGYQYFDWANLVSFARPDNWNLIRFHKP